MPIDPRSYFIQTPQMQGPLDAYREFMSLRDMMDRRRYNDMQMRRLQLQEEKDQREEAERQAFRNVLSSGNATDQQLIQADPELAWKYITSRATGQKEQRLAEEAQTKAQDANIARRKGIRQQIANIGMSAVSIADPMQRAQYFGGELSRLIDEGTLKPEEFTEWQIPADRREAERLYRSAYNPKALQDFLDAEAKGQYDAEEAARKNLMFAPEYAKARTDAERSGQVLLGTAKPSPAALPALFEQWLPGYLSSNRLADNPENRTRAVGEYHKLLGISQGMSPEAVQQRLDLFEREAALKREAEKNKPQSAEASKTTSIAETLVPELTDLKKRIAAGGKPAILAILTGSDPELRKLAVNASDKVGRLRSGGAVNPAEEARFMGAIASLLDLAPWVEGTMPSQNAIDRYITEADVVLRGIKPGGNTAAPAGTNQPVIRWGRDANGNPVRLP